MPKKGRGQYRKLAEFLRTSNVVISQIFNGEKDLNLDQALLTSQFLGFGELETDFFLLLVSKERAAHFELKNYYDQQIKELKKKASHLKSHLNNTKSLSDEVKQIYYSDWLYSALRLACAKDSIHNEEDLSKYFQIPIQDIRQKTSFLLKYGILKREENGLEIGTNTIFVDKNSPMINFHRKNWRLRGFQEMSNQQNLFYVSPMCISKNLFKKAKNSFLKIIKELHDDIPNEDAEELVCINLDIYKF